MSENNSSFMDKLSVIIDKISAPLVAFANIPWVASISEGMTSSMSVTMVGSIFLIIGLMGNGSVGFKLGFLEPFANQLCFVNSISMGIIGIYMVIGMGAAYARKKGFDTVTGSVLSVLAFFALTYAPEDIANGFPTGFWGGAGIITAIISMLLVGNITYACYKYNFKITLPDSVPPAIADSFSAIIPAFLITLVCWLVRTIAGINIPELVGNMLLPVLSAADNIWVYTINCFLIALLWSVGLHGDNITGAVTGTFKSIWFQENQEAVAAGVSFKELPHIFCGNIDRVHMWVTNVWPIIVYMYLGSKEVPQWKTLATVALPPAIFCIIEPVMFGLPMVLNPYIVLPFIITHTLSGFGTYLFMQLGIMGRMGVTVPWATPSPIIGYICTGGDWFGVANVFIWFAFGMVVFFPFWRAYQKSEVARMAAEEA